MARRVRRTSKRKKKKDPTAFIVIVLSALAFVFVAGFFLLSNTSSSGKKTTSKSQTSSATVSKDASIKKTNDHAPTTGKDTSKNIGTVSKPKKAKRETPPQRPSISLEKPAPTKLPETPERQIFARQTVNTIPASLILPDQPVTRRNLTEGIGFTDASTVKIQFHCVNTSQDKKPSMHCTNPGSGKWLFRLTGSDEELAELQVTPKGLFFTWHPEAAPAQRSLLHNCKLTFSDGSDSKTVQLRPIRKAPEIMLFSQDGENEYSLRVMHAPGEIHWSLEPSDKTLAPFNFPTVGPPTTDGPVPLEKSVEWTPENNTGIVKARYKWQCTAKPGIRKHEKRITINQKKEYKIGDARWRPLTTDSLRDDFDTRLEKYDNVVAGIRRKWLKGKAPSLKQVTKLKEMIREGAAFADVRSFYYAVPEREIKLEFRTPCGTTDTLLAKFPVDAALVDQVRIPEPSPSRKITIKPEEPPATDEAWTASQGENPWAARQQQLEKMTGGTK